MQDGCALSATGFQTSVVVQPFYKASGYLDCYQNLIACSFRHPRRFRKISLQFIHNILSNVANKQTDKQTNAIENNTSFANEVMIDSLL